MMYYTPQIWCSDNTDAIDRTAIQYGTSFGYPVSTVGAHVSIVPNHQTGRVTPMKTRGIVAMAGTFGYELNLSKISEDDKAQIRQQVQDFHKFAPLIQNGDYYRLSNPLTDGTAAWAVVAEDKSEALVSCVLLAIHGNMPNVYISVRGLECGCLYRDEESGAVYSADALAEIGLPVTVPMSEYAAFRWHLKRV